MLGGVALLFGGLVVLVVRSVRAREAAGEDDVPTPPGAGPGA